MLPQPSNGTDSYCFDIPARVYVQYYCDIDSTQEQINENSFNWLIYFSVGSAVFFLSMLGLHTIRTQQNKARKMRDLVYPAAFSVGMRVTDELWRIVKVKHLESGTQESLISFFRAELILYLNQALRDCADDPNDNTDVAFISWNCLSSKRLQLLQERANYVSTG